MLVCNACVSYSPYLFDDTLGYMTASWPHHKVSLKHAYDNILGDNIKVLFDDPLSKKVTKALILGLEIEWCRSQTLESLAKEPLRQSIWLKNQRYFLIEGPRCPKKMRISSKQVVFGAKLERYGPSMWFNERDITSRWKKFQESLRPGDVICVVLSVKTELRIRNGEEEIVIVDEYAGMEFKDLLQTFSSHHWVNIVLVAQHASMIASKYGMFLPERTCLLTADSSIWLSVNPLASFLCICLHRIIHSPAEPTTQIIWSLDKQVWRLELDEKFAERTKAKISDESHQARVHSTLKAMIGSHELGVIENTFKTLIAQEEKTVANIVSAPVPAALALAFQVIIAADL
jgi:hypothetical protein